MSAYTRYANVGLARVALQTWLEGPHQLELRQGKGRCRGAGGARVHAPGRLVQGFALPREEGCVCARAIKAERIPPIIVPLLL